MPKIQQHVTHAPVGLRDCVRALRPISVTQPALSSPCPVDRSRLGPGSWREGPRCHEAGRRDTVACTVPRSLDFCTATWERLLVEGFWLSSDVSRLWRSAGDPLDVDGAS